MKFDLLKWIQHQDPSTMPFRPGAHHTAPFGLREHNATIEKGGSPGHLGNDRSGTPPEILMPFHVGYEEWKHVGGMAGSLLTIMPETTATPAILQIMHTRNNYSKTAPYKHKRKRGETLRAYTSDLGFSVGPHTHTEFIVQSTPYTYSSVMEMVDPSRDVLIYNEKGFAIDVIQDHCKNHDMDFQMVLKRLNVQVNEWDIKELWTTFAVRRRMPLYRTPPWGMGHTIHLCTRTFLDI